MTKQQAISLKLAQWLGYEAKLVSDDGTFAYIWISGTKSKEFNPFAPTTEGRAQFAECVIKATQSGFDVHMMNIASRCYSKETMHGYRYHTQDTSPDAVVTATLEAIYYAIGGTDTWSGAND